METARPAPDDLNRIATTTIALAAIESAAIFVLAPDDGSLELGAAAGVDGPPLDRLVEAVKDPAHPIAQTARDGVASFNVTPTAPGGPALRSHLPLIERSAEGRRVLGVLAVAHQERVDTGTQISLEALAAQAGLAVASR